jgi:hypothetical protein
MPYGEGKSKKELKAGARLIAARKVETWIVTAPGARFTTGTKEDAAIIKASFPGATMRKAD